jgi:exopolysaccharide biosynthesis polyprenyl glycosylphosphotransferase
MTIAHEEVPLLAPVERVKASARTLQTKLGLMAADAGVSVLAFLAASELVESGTDRVAGVLVFVVAGAFWLARGRLYSSRFITRRADEIRRIIDAVVLAAATVAVAAFVLPLDVGRAWVGITALLTVVGLSLEREVVRRYYASMRQAGKLSRKIIMVGDNTESRQLEAMFAGDRSLGYQIMERIDPSQSSDANHLVTATLAAARAHGAGGVIVAATGIDTRSSNRLIRDLIESGIHVELSSTLADIAPNRLTVRPLGRFPVVYIEPVQRHGWRAVAKRLFDMLSSLAACIVLAPVFVVVALLIKVTSEGPVLFKQSRVGKDGLPFDVFKFRTMVVNAEALMADLLEDNEGAGPLFKMKDDPRVTRIGSFMRKTSIDELPQLWNVVRGEMSLVGPRPALASEMSEWDEDLYGRLRVRPGITGMWQVSGRSETSFEEYTRLDLYYVDNWSLVVDLAILAKTLPAVLKSDGAY